MADPTLVSTLSTLSTQLDTLSTSLEPLLKVPLADLLAQQDEPLVKAKLDVLVSYALHDLIWVYLKTSGVDPTNHPVMQEIERLKGYFAKLKSAESGQQPQTPSTVQTNDRRRMQIDKKAASRFINHAIASQKARTDPDYTPAEGDEDIEMGTHTRFDAEDAETEGEAVEENEEVERLLDDKEEDEEEAVEEAQAAVETDGKNKGKRRILDPFAGYDQPKAPSSVEKRKRPTNESAVPTTNSGASTPLESSASVGEIEATSTTESASKKKKKKKDAKKLKMKK